MNRPKTDWPNHIKQFRASKQTVADYCTAVGLKPGTFQYHLYRHKKKQKAKGFEELTVAPELVIAKDQRGGLTLSGFDAAQLPQIIDAWANALSH